jgi:hypothetical protein
MEFGKRKLTFVTQPSPLYRLIESKLDEPLTDFVAARRLPTKSWREIADEIYERTGETVTGERIRQWFADADTPASTPSASAA